MTWTWRPWQWLNWHCFVVYNSHNSFFLQPWSIDPTLLAYSRNQYSGMLQYRRCFPLQTPLNKTSNFHLSPKHKSLTITKFITQAERSSSKFRELYIQKNIVTFLCDCACVFGVDPSHGCVYVQICLLSKDIKRRGGSFILNIARNAQVWEQDT